MQRLAAHCEQRMTVTSTGCWCRSTVLEAEMAMAMAEEGDHPLPRAFRCPLDECSRPSNELSETRRRTRATFDVRREVGFVRHRKTFPSVDEI